MSGAVQFGKKRPWAMQSRREVAQTLARRTIGYATSSECGNNGNVACQFSIWYATHNPRSYPSLNRPAHPMRRSVCGRAAPSGATDTCGIRRVDAPRKGPNAAARIPIVLHTCDHDARTGRLHNQTCRRGFPPVADLRFGDQR